MYTFERDRYLNGIKKRNDRENYLIKKYRVTLEEYEKVLNEQGGVCAVCKKSSKNALAVDVYPEAREIIKGLLCVGCQNHLVVPKEQSYQNALKEYTQKKSDEVVKIMEMKESVEKLYSEDIKKVV